MKHRRNRRGRALFGAVAGLSAAALIVGCSTPRPPRPAPPVQATGDPIVGVNPDVPTTPDTRDTKVRYGPWTVPAASGPAHEDGGMIKNRVAFGVEKPCQDCYITGIQATLVYPDGRPANVDTGLWLHHMVLSTFGRRDPTCGDAPLQLAGERFFASGNERTRMRLPAGAGLRVNTGDSWILVYDLMNLEMVPQDAAIEVTYTWAPGDTPGIVTAKPVWLDVGPCGGADLPSSSGQYHYANEWTVNVPGRVVGIGAHLHDGGTNMLIRNETNNTVLCDSKAGYGGPGFEKPGAGDGHAGHGGADEHGHLTSHLSSMTQCVARSLEQPVAVLSAGERVSFYASYDADRYPHGDHPVMGIAMMYVV